MKKIYTLAVAALFCGTMANAQTALKITNNFYMKTCAILPEGTHPVKGDDSNVVCADENKIENIADKLAVANLDEEGTTFPLSGGTAAGTNYHVLDQDYTDPETGASFKAGTYSCLNSNTEIKFKDEYNMLGLSNIKQVIFYLASQGQLQFYAREYNDKTEQDGEYINFEGDPTNRKLKSYYAPGFSTPFEIDGAQSWNEMHFTKPLKLIVDLTNAEGTDNETKNANLSIKNGDNIEVVKSNLQFYEQVKDADGKVSQGTNLIPWTADNMYAFAFKKKAYVMGIAVICGTEGAEMRTIDLSEEDPQWSNSATGINEVVKNTLNTNNRIYSIDGKFVGTNASVLSNGIYVQNGKKFVK